MLSFLNVDLSCMKTDKFVGFKLYLVCNITRDCKNSQRGLLFLESQFINGKCHMLIITRQIG